MNNHNTTTKSTTAIQTENAIQALRETWTKTTRGMQADEIASHIDTLRDQIRGEYDMSAEDMDEAMAEMLGWELPMTEQQTTDWETIVVWAAKEWLIEDMAVEMVDSEEIDEMPNAEAIADMADLLGEELVEIEDIRRLIGDYCHR